MIAFRFAVAVLAAAALILSAPFVSRARNALRAALPDGHVLILGAIVGASLLAGLLAAAVLIRDRRGLRYGSIGLAWLIAGLYSFATSSPDPHVAAVERFHFVQYGIITFLFYRAWRPLEDAGIIVLPVLAAMLTGTLEEWFQWFIPGRVGEMKDVFLNWVAILCGMLFALGLDPPAALTARLGARSRQHAASAAALFVLVFGMFFDAVHLGHRIEDPHAGVFDSIYTAPELAAHAADRRARWQDAPPVDRTRLAQEDQYRTEGIQHVQARNAAWARGDIASAWRENLILERHYGPVLETGHAWSEAQRRDAQARAGDPLAAFESGAYPYRIYHWPSAVHWAAVLMAAGGLIALGWRVPPATRRAAVRRLGV